jgi:HK97 family phage portal protein
MGLFSGPREKRYNGFQAQFVQPPVPTNATSSPFAWLNMNRAETSMQKIAIWSAVDLIASMAAALPIDVYSGTGEISRPVSTPSYLLDVAGDGYGTADWIHQALVSYLLRGNLYGKVVERDTRGGYATQVPLYHPDEVHGWRDPDDGLPRWKAGGVEIPRADVFHRRAYPMPGLLLGLSPITYHAMTIGLGMSATRFGLEFFQDGANPTGMLTNELEELNEAKARTAKERFIAALNGTREPVVLGKGWKWQQIQIAPEESQFLETNKYTEAQCARVYGPGVAEILGYDTGTTMTYQNVEQRDIHLLTYALDKWLVKIEGILSDMLPRPRFVKLNRAALLRTDLLTRYKAHTLAIAGHFMVPSEARVIEDMPPLTEAQLAEQAALNLPAPVLMPTTEKEK